MKLESYNDSLHGSVEITDFEKNIINSIAFNRLHDIYQNSTAYLTFPTNRTKRFEHSIGAMSICSKMFYYCLRNSDENVIEKIQKKLMNLIDDLINQKEIIKDLNIIYKGKRISKDDIFSLNFTNFEKSLIPANITNDQSCVFILFCLSLRFAALVHDIGHPPFSHIVELAMKNVYENYKEVKQDNDYIKNLNDYVNSDEMENQSRKLQLHEKMGKQIIDRFFSNILLADSNAKNDKNRLLLNYLIIKLGEKIFMTPEREEDGYKFLHNFISYSLDCDRLDYVSRDLINSGINCGTIDYDRILHGLKFYISDSDSDSNLRGINFILPIKSVNAVEDFFKRRIRLYKDVLYHHRVVKTDYLLSHMVESLIKNHISDICKTDIDQLWRVLEAHYIDDCEIALSQWNDSWLLTFLKKIYLEKFSGIKTPSDPSDKIIKKQMEEFLQNKKNYTSLIKRREDFKIIDDAIRERFKDKEIDFEQLLNKFDNTILNKNIFKKNFMNLFQEKNASFILYQLMDLDSAGFKIKKEFIQENIKECLDKELGEQYLDAIVVFKTLNPGINGNEDIWFYGQDEIYSLTEISNIVQILNLEKCCWPGFFVLCLPNDNCEINSQNLLKKIGEYLGDKLVEHLKNFLNNTLKILVRA